MLSASHFFYAHALIKGNMETRISYPKCFGVWISVPKSHLSGAKRATVGQTLERWRKGKERRRKIRHSVLLSTVVGTRTTIRSSAFIAFLWTRYGEFLGPYKKTLGIFRFPVIFHLVYRTSVIYLMNFKYLSSHFIISTTVKSG